MFVSNVSTDEMPVFSMFNICEVYEERFCDGNFSVFSPFGNERETSESSEKEQNKNFGLTVVSM